MKTKLQITLEIDAEYIIKTGEVVVTNPDVLQENAKVTLWLTEEMCFTGTLQKGENGTWRIFPEYEIP